MRDPNLDMDQSTTMGQQATNGESEPRRNHHKSARVAFGPDLETHIPPRDKSPVPTAGHHRSFTTVEQKQPPVSPPPRPTSSSGENAIDPEPHSRVSSDRASDSGRPFATLKRAKSDYGPRLGLDKTANGDDEDDFAMRHGWQEEYTSSEYLKILHSVSRSSISRDASLGVRV